MAASDKRGTACWLSSLIPQARPRHLRVWFAAGLLLIGGVGTVGAQNDAEAEALSDVKIFSHEKLGGIDTVVIAYSLSYPTKMVVTVKAWIDPKTLRPIQRMATTKEGMTLIESIGRVAIDKEIPYSKFIFEPAVSGAPSPAPEDQHPAR